MFLCVCIDMGTYANSCIHSFLYYQVINNWICAREKSVYVSVDVMVTMSGESSCARSLANSLLSAGRQANFTVCVVVWVSSQLQLLLSGMPR